MEPPVGVNSGHEGLPSGAKKKGGNGIGSSDVSKEDLQGSEVHETMSNVSAAVVPPSDTSVGWSFGHVEVESGATNQPSSPQTQIPRSFASIFKDAANIRKSGTLRFIAPTVTDIGTKKAVISESLIASQAGKWSNTLVGYFVGKRPAFPFVKFHANRLWKQFELEDVVLNDQGYFFFKFNSEQGLLHVLENGPWLFNDFPVLIQRWHPGVWFEKPKPSKVHMWVNIYDLCDVLWDFEILSRIVSVIGVPIIADRYTVEKCNKKTGRVRFARILVEICADQEIPSFVEADIMGIDRRFRLQYHWTPPMCSHCKIFGHNFDTCSVRPRTVAELEAKIANAETTSQVDLSGVKISPTGAQQSDPSGGQEHDGFQPAKRRRRPKKKPENGTRKMQLFLQLWMPTFLPLQLELSQ